jgi:hypothetical protein
MNSIKQNLIVSILCIVTGIKIIYTKQIKQGNSAMSMSSNVLYLGEYSFIIGGLFIILGTVILYFLKTNKKL